MDKPVISLFSGAMGLDLGLQSAGMNIRISQDIDPWCAKTMSENGYPYVLGDIKKLIEEDPSCKFLLRPAGLYPGEVFLVAGGPPCQPFSTAGKRLGTNDPRGSLFREFVHVIEHVKPRFFIMENVKGLLSSTVKPLTLKERKEKKILDPDEQPGSVFQIICKEFERIGYSIVYGLLDAVHYGVPQFRERLVIIGSRDHEDIFLPIPTHFHRHQNPDFRWKTLRSAIEDLEENPGQYLNFSEERLYFLRQVPQGGNWRNLNPHEIATAMGGAYLSSGGKVGFYRRLDYDQPAPTLVTSPVQKATMLCHPTQHRPLSVREYARVQQFPDNWHIAGSLADCYRQIGNAVPVGLGKAIGMAVVATAEGTAEVKVKRMRGTSVHENLPTVEQNIIHLASQ